MAALSDAYWHLCRHTFQIQDGSRAFFYSRTGQGPREKVLGEVSLGCADLLRRPRNRRASVCSTGWRCIRTDRALKDKIVTRAQLRDMQSTPLSQNG